MNKRILLIALALFACTAQQRPADRVPPPAENNLTFRQDGYVVALPLPDPQAWTQRKDAFSVLTNAKTGAKISILSADAASGTTAYVAERMRTEAGSTKGELGVSWPLCVGIVPPRPARAWFSFLRSSHGRLDRGLAVVTQVERLPNYVVLIATWPAQDGDQTLFNSIGRSWLWIDSTAADIFAAAQNITAMPLKGEK